MRILLAFVTILLQASIALAQPAPPTFNILQRVLMVQSQNERGSIFALDVDQREYWVTAKHILTGAKHLPVGSITSKSMVLSILDPSSESAKWLPVNFTVIDPGNDIDIVVLAPPEPLLGPLPSITTTSEGILLGGDCEFLGFPFGGGWRATYANGQSFWMPYVKHCTVSAAPKYNDPTAFWVLDGINNEGFSGGPVIFQTGPQQKIMGVVSSYAQEPADVVPAGPDNSASKKLLAEKPKPMEHPKEIVELNAGFIIAFDIKYAIEAIHKNPIGPLCKTK